jgi:hypothetical protein
VKAYPSAYSSAAARPARAHAARPLFLLQFRRTLLPLAAVCYGVYAVLVAAWWVLARQGTIREQDIPDLFHWLALSLPAFAAAPTGGAAFSKLFKEQHILFFHSLPFPRGRQWLTMMLANAAALLATLGGFFIIRPAIVSVLTPRMAANYAIGIATLFAAGACFSLLVRNAVGVYVAALAGITGYTSAVIALLAMSEKEFNSRGSHRAPALALLLDGTSQSAAAVLVAAFIVAMLLLSLHFYRRGEVALLKTQVANIAKVVVTLAAILLIGAPLLNAAIAARGERDIRYEISADAHYAAFVTAPWDYPWRSRLRIVDLSNGATLVDRREPGIVMMRWAGNHLLLGRREVASLRRLGTLLPPHDAVEVLAPDGTRLTRISHAGLRFTDLLVKDEAHYLAAWESGGKGAVDAIDAKGSSSEIVHGPAGNVYLGRDFAYFADLALGSKMFRLNGTELPWRRIETRDSEVPLVVRGVGYGSIRIAAQLIDAATPLPRKAGESIHFALSPMRSIDHVYAVTGHADGTAALYELPVGESAWRLVADGIQLPQFFRTDLILRQPPTLTISNRLAMAAWVARDGVYVHGPHTPTRRVAEGPDLSIETSAMHGAAGRPFLSVSRHGTVVLEMDLESGRPLPLHRGELAALSDTREVHLERHRTLVVYEGGVARRRVGF